jgi:hypothetical protein
MAQTMYAHMNKWINLKKEKKRNYFCILSSLTWSIYEGGKHCLGVVYFNTEQLD